MVFEENNVMEVSIFAIIIDDSSLPSTFIRKLKIKKLSYVKSA